MVDEPHVPPYSAEPFRPPEFEQAPGRRRRRGRASRTAAATVEMALMMPLMILIVFGCLEVCQRLLLRQTASVAAYETARMAARRGASMPQALERGQTILTERRVEDGVVQLIPQDVASLPTGGELQVLVTIPIAGNSSLSYVLPTEGTITVRSTMLRE